LNTHLNNVKPQQDSTTLALVTEQNTIQ